MDYEKKYNEALERAQKVTQAGGDVAVVIVQNIFPELRESEDERIIQNLIDAFTEYKKSGGVDFHGIEINTLLAWLEKQKELFESGRGLYYYDGEKFTYCGSPVTEENPHDFTMSQQEKQKEQKPVMIQWTGKNLKEVIDFTGKSPKFDEWFNSWADFENYVHSHDDILKLFCEDGSHYEVPVGAWIVKTPDGYNIPSRFRFIQKPAEWDKLQEEFRNINEAFEDGKKEVVAHPVKYGLCRPAEWSEEEEEKIIEGFYTLIRGIRRAGGLTLNKVPLDKCEALLKSLRSSWKPSEEQMAALSEAVSTFDGYEESDAIKSLYNDLKKLL